MVLKKTMPFFYGDTEAMNNKLISTIITLSLMFVLVHYDTATGSIIEAYKDDRYINKKSCVRMKTYFNRMYKMAKNYKYIRTECVSAKNYIPRTTKRKTPTHPKK